MSTRKDMRGIRFDEKFERKYKKHWKPLLTQMENGMNRKLKTNYMI